MGLIGGEAALAIGLAAAGTWCYLLLFRGAFWAVSVPETPSGPLASGPVVAVIPARNEAPSIGAAVTSLLAQKGIELSIIVVDDHSSDGTADAARQAAAAAGAAARLEVIAAGPLPQGWTGKLWAVREGIEQARQHEPERLLLTDADIVHDPEHVPVLLRRAETERRDLVSEMVLLRAESLAERTLIPAFVFFFFMLYPPRWTADPRRRSAGAAGGCMLVRTEMLDRIGGIAVIRSELIDDCALAGAVKRAGGRLSLSVTRSARSLREYEGVGEIWQMVSRTAFTQLGYSGLALLGTLLGLFVTYMAPPLLVLWGSGPARLAGGFSWLAMAALFLPTLRLYRLSPLWAPCLPAIALFYAAATLGSALAYWTGRGGQWKGRAQALRSAG